MRYVESQGDRALFFRALELRRKADFVLQYCAQELPVGHMEHIRRELQPKSPRRYLRTFDSKTEAKRANLNALARGSIVPHIVLIAAYSEKAYRDITLRLKGEDVQSGKLTQILELKLFEMRGDLYKSTVRIPERDYIRTFGQLVNSPKYRDLEYVERCLDVLFSYVVRELYMGRKDYERKDHNYR